ncbi:holin [Bifidobacterium callimiconis]|uniref:holin n=1 Tax=Bifidobacterium callimiconis TaxID=2306973 RepID=UPI0030B80448
MSPPNRCSLEPTGIRDRPSAPGSTQPRKILEEGRGPPIDEIPQHAAEPTAGTTSNPVLWARAAGLRAVKTAAQAALAVIGTGAVGILTVDWANIGSVAVMAAIVSLLTSIAGIPEVDNGTSLQKC